MTFPVGLETVTVTVGPILALDGTPRNNSTVSVTPSAAVTHVPSETFLDAATQNFTLGVDGTVEITLAASDAMGNDASRTYTFEIGIKDNANKPIGSITKTVTLPASAPEVSLTLTEAVAPGTTELEGVPFVVSIGSLTGAITAEDAAGEIEPYLSGSGAVDSVAGLTGAIASADLVSAISADLPEDAVTSVAGLTGDIASADLASAMSSDIQDVLSLPFAPIETEQKSKYVFTPLYDSRPRTREYMLWDNFDRPNTVTTLGTASCGSLWHNSSSCRVWKGGVQRVAGIGSRATAAMFNIRRNIRVGAWFDVAGATDFDCGFVIRSKDDATNKMIIATACDSTSAVKLILRTPSADNTVATETVSFNLGQRYYFEIQDLNNTIKFFVDGTEVLTYDLAAAGDIYGGQTEQQFYADTYDVGLTFHHTRDNFSRVEGFTVKNLGPRTLPVARPIAHRGAIMLGPENSIESLKRLPRDTFAVEVDARQSSDGVWVCMHDATVDRTTENGTGNVADLTAEQISQLIIKQGGGLVPTLTEFLDACEALGIPEVWVDHAGGSETELGDFLEAHSYAANIVAFADSVTAASNIKSTWATGRFAVGQVTAANVASVVSDATTLGGVEALLIAPNDATFEANIAAVATIIAGGFAAGASVVSLSETVIAAIDAGCSIILNDYAHLLYA